MSEGNELVPTEFQLQPCVNFEAKDVVHDLGALDTISLIEELGVELDSWESTILLARYFHKLSLQAPTELLEMTSEALEIRLDQETSDGE